MPADMLIKVIRVGIPIIISNAAPASSGIDVASAGNITIAPNMYTNVKNLFVDVVDKLSSNG